MFHENGYDHIDKHELRHKHEHDEEHWRYDTIDPNNPPTLILTQSALTSISTRLAVYL